MEPDKIMTVNRECLRIMRAVGWLESSHSFLESFQQVMGEKVKKVGRDIFMKNFELQVMEFDIMKTVKEGNNSVMKMVYFSKSDLVSGW